MPTNLSSPSCVSDGDKKRQGCSRHQARILILQALYQRYYTGHTMQELEEQFMNKSSMKESDSYYFKRILSGIIERIDQLDMTFEPNLDRPIEHLTPIELNALRLATYELLYCEDVPYRVVINEALQLTKQFGTQDGFKFVNGVLHALAMRVRCGEASRSGKTTRE